MDESMKKDQEANERKYSHKGQPSYFRGRTVENGKRVIRFDLITKEMVAINLARVLGRAIVTSGTAHG